MTNKYKRMKRYCFTMLVLLTSLVAAGQTNHNLDVAKNLDIFNQVYKNLDLLYVDTLNPNELVGTGIKAMLRSLDPYTEYYPESETKNLKMKFFLANNFNSQVGNT